MPCCTRRILVPRFACLSKRPLGHSQLSDATAQRSSARPLRDDHRLHPQVPGAEFIGCHQEAASLEAAAFGYAARREEGDLRGV